MKLTLLAILMLCCWMTSSVGCEADKDPKFLDYTILQVRDHNPKSFTQGLIYKQDTLIETSGLYRQSFIYAYKADTGEEVKRKRLPNNIFAEGLTIFDNKIYVLSWRAGQAYLLKYEDFDYIKTLTYQGEGWGITHNQTHLITSNGSDKLSIREASDFSVVRQVTVHSGSKRFTHLNELEYAQNLIWANVWKTSEILAINPTTGKVEGIASFEALVKENSTRLGESVLNGIAYDAEKNAFWITGKLWPKRYLIQFHWANEKPRQSNVRRDS